MFRHGNILSIFFNSGGAEPKFDCENYGDQGITAGCKDIYHANIDCQWLDVTDLDLGTYIFKMSINPQYKASIFLAYIVTHYIVMYLDSSAVFSKAMPLIAYQTYVPFLYSLLTTEYSKSTYSLVPCIVGRLHFFRNHGVLQGE